MIELLRSNDPVFLSYIQHLLGEEGIAYVLLDGYISSIEGSIGAFPRRLMVADCDFISARLLVDNHSLTLKD